MGVNVAEHFHLTWHRAKKIKKINRKEGGKDAERPDEEKVQEKHSP